MRYKHLIGPWPDFLAHACISALSRAVMLLILFHLPVVGLPATIAALPVLHGVPGLGETGTHVSYLSGYVVLRSGYAWLIVGIYYFAAVLVWHGVRRFLLRARTPACSP